MTAPIACAHCGATKPPDAPTAAQHGWDSSLVWHGTTRLDGGGVVNTCSRACRKALGLRERYRVFTRDPLETP